MEYRSKLECAGRNGQDICVQWDPAITKCHGTEKNVRLNMFLTDRYNAGVYWTALGYSTKAQVKIPTCSYKEFV